MCWLNSLHQFAGIWKEHCTAGKRCVVAEVLVNLLCECAGSALAIYIHNRDERPDDAWMTNNSESAWFGNRKLAVKCPVSRTGTWGKWPPFTSLEGQHP